MSILPRGDRIGRVRTWLTRLGRRKKTLGALFIVVTGLAAWGGVRTRHYFTEDRASCLACHTAAQIHLRERSHRDLECSACHSVKFSETFAQYLASKFRGSKAYVEHAQPEPGRCVQCHLSGAVGVRPLASTKGHQVHVLGGPKLSCQKCHGGETHVESPNPQACVGCHKNIKVFDPAMAGVACVSCHNFLARSTPQVPGSGTDCQRCHGGLKAPDRSQRFANTLKASIIDSDMVHGAVNACGLCHNPHAAQPSERVTGQDCSRCHARISRELVSAEDPGHTGCEMCHEVHGPRPELADLCTACHSDRTASSEPRALSSRHQACQDCHAAHRFAPSRQRCADCHQQQQKLVAAWPKTPGKPKTADHPTATDKAAHNAPPKQTTAHKNCLDCHSGHSEKPPTSACTSCHPAASAHGHGVCTTCHDPHRDKSATKTCATCHKNEQRIVLAAGRPAPHRLCASCHVKHAPLQAGARCRACHGAQAAAVQTASAPPHQRCSSCHRPHDFHGNLGACTGCHQPGSLGPHRQACTKCHQVHGAPGGAQVNCQGCHAGIPQPTGKHARCRSCHSPHQSKRGEPACTSCHAIQSRGTSAWPAAEHQTCATCHQKHQPRQVKACATCHGSQAQGVSASKHQCGSCHNPHRAPLKWWSTCATCHQGKVAATRGLGPTHGRCASCHEPHAVKKPACQSCHSGLPGAHAAKGHRVCTNCHRTHALGLPSRAQCLDCHKDKTDHFPNAQLCSACHPFK